MVLTHLHSDHIGWAGPLFPNADHLVQRAELDALELFHPELPARLIGPLRAAGRLRVVDGDTALTPAVRLLSTRGHTPGHQSVLVDSDDDRLLVTGDLLVHAVQLVEPDLAYAHEKDPPTARTSRLALLRALTAPGPATLATPFVPLPRPVHPADHGVGGTRGDRHRRQLHDQRESGLGRRRRRGTPVDRCAPSRGCHMLEMSPCLARTASAASFRAASSSASRSVSTTRLTPSAPIWASTPR